MPDFTSAIALLKKPIEDIYVGATGALKQRLAVVRAARKVKELHTRLWQIQRVKTIWNTDRALSLGSIFYPVDARIVGETYESIRNIQGIDDLLHARCIIYGTAGQGKSILVKYLVGREIKSGKRIPLLCELRDVGDLSLEDYLIQRFSLLLGINSDAEVFSAFAISGKISFLLDGFDEIESSKVQSALHEIDALAFKYPEAKILLTSRPDAECRSLAGFGAAYVRPLAAADLFPFFKKITKDSDFSDKIVKAIEGSPLGIRSLVTTPLLATLLAISYRAAHKIPLEFSEFYEELFQVLLVRHDAAKLGWRRKRESGLTDRQIQQVFEAFCFAVRRQKSLSVGVEKSLDLIDEACKNLQFNLDAQAYLNDVRRITCLVLQDGKKIEYVHASVAHYFAARYIRSRPESIAGSFYDQVLDLRWHEWVEELRFLRQIDSHRFNRYFYIKDASKTVAYFDGENGFQSNCEKYLRKLLIEKVVNSAGEVSYRIRVGRVLRTFSESIIIDNIFRRIFSTSYDDAKSWVRSFIENPGNSVISYYDIAKHRGGSVLHNLCRTIEDDVTTIRRDLADASANVEHAEQATDFIKI